MIEKILHEYKERGEKDNFTYSIFRILTDLLLNKYDEEYLSDYKKIAKLQKKIANVKELIDKSESSLIDINDLDYEICQVMWNIEVFQQISSIYDIIHKLSDITPNSIQIASNRSCGVFFLNDTTNTLNELIKITEKLRVLKEEIDYILKIKKDYPDFSERIGLRILTDNIN